MLELNQVACFIAIVEEGNFSQAAERLGLAQSVVSQRLRRLEDLAGIQLFERTSRRVKLSQAGLEFLPFAQQLLAAESRARQEAARLRDRARRTVRLGGYAFSSRRRARLIESYLASSPSNSIEVEYAGRNLLIEMLRHDQIDAFLCLEGPDGPMPEFASIAYSEIHPHVSFPEGHRFAATAAAALSELRGLELAISPGRQDPCVMDLLTRVASTCGVTLLEAPEAERSYITKFAIARGLPILHWLCADEFPFVMPGFVTVPLDEPALHLRYYLYTNRNVHRPAVEALRISAAAC